VPTASTDDRAARLQKVGASYLARSGEPRYAQFGDPLTPAGYRVIESLLAEDPKLWVRSYGTARSLDFAAHLPALRALKSLDPLQHAPALESLSVTDMMQFRVEDYAPLREHRRLRRVSLLRVGSLARREQIERLLGRLGR
jgi:hypothetical protein